VWAALGLVSVSHSAPDDRRVEPRATDKGADDRRLDELSQQLRRIEEQIASLRKETAAPTPTPATRPAQTLLGVIEQIEARMKDLRAAKDLPPQQLRERLVAFLREQQERLAKMDLSAAPQGTDVRRPAAKLNILQTAQNAAQFKTLLSLVKAAGLEDVLAGKGPFTLFAPTDEAFAALPRGTVDKLLEPQSKDRLVAILKNHVVGESKVRTRDIGARKTVESLAGRELRIDSQEGALSVNGVHIVKGDIEASNGVIHVVGQVLLPTERPRPAVRIEH
jgi:uncharacterized surface protein with fasciclin (FAS1) repeats